MHLSGSESRNQGPPLLSTSSVTDQVQQNGGASSASQLNARAQEFVQHGRATTAPGANRAMQTPAEGQLRPADDRAERPSIGASASMQVRGPSGRSGRGGGRNSRGADDNGGRQGAQGRSREGAAHREAPVPASSSSGMSEAAQQQGLLAAEQQQGSNARARRQQRRLQDGLGAETAETSIATSPGNASAPRTQPRAAGSAGQQQQRVGHGHAADGTGGGMGGSRPGYMSANHLLNFQYDGTRSGAGGRGGRMGGRGPAGSSHPTTTGRRHYPAQRPQKYDRNKFLQANFRFVVSDAMDIAPYEADADRMFDWEDVVQVEMRSAAPVQCPISLDTPPLCAQITPCGHIFSFPAIMHHLVNHGGPELRRSAPCPLCFGPLVARELRLLRVRIAALPKVGDMLTLRLLRRPAGSIIPEPVPTSAFSPSALIVPDALPHGQEPADAVAASGASAAAAEHEHASQSSSSTYGLGKGHYPSSSGSGSGALAAGVPGGGGPVHAPNALDQNPFAKFAVTTNASALWRDAAQQLAASAAQVLSEGGLEAAMEAPFIYAALDALADRAKRFAARRVEQAQERLALLHGQPNVPGAAGHVAAAAATAAAGAGAGGVTHRSIASALEGGVGMSPEAAGAAAEAEVKQFFVAAVTGSASTSSTGTNTSTTTSGNKAPASSASAPNTSRSTPSQAAVAATGFPALAVSTPTAARASLQPLPPSTGSTCSTSNTGGAGGSDGSPQPGVVPGRSSNVTAQLGSIAAAAGQAVAGDGVAAMPATVQSVAVEEQEDRLPFQDAFSDDDDEGAHPNPHMATSAYASEAIKQSPRPAPSLPVPLGASLGRDSSTGAGSTSASGSMGVLGVLGSSPPEHSVLNAAGRSGEHYMYQEAGGAWMFLHPLNLKCLLQQYGGYERCPPSLHARTLELEECVQGEASRRKLRPLAHLPLTGAFTLAEVQLAGLLPPEALAPFSEELTARDKRRKRRAADVRRSAAAEAHAARTTAAARLGPSAEELKAMPKLGQASEMPGGAELSENGGNVAGGGGVSGAGRLNATAAAAVSLAREMNLSAAELAESLALQASLDDHPVSTAAHGTSLSDAQANGAGVSFARMTKLGFAATGPALGAAMSPALGAPLGGGGGGGGSGGVAAGGTMAMPAGAWGARAAGGGKSGSSGPGPGTSSSPWTSSSLNASGGAASSSTPPGPWVTLGGNRNSVASMLKAAGAPLPGAPSSSTLPLGGTSSGSVASAAGGEGSGAGGKKGKGKGMVLFSTGSNQRKF